MDPENSARERSESKEGKESPEGGSSASPETLRAEAASETAAFEAGGLPAAERLARELKVDLDGETAEELRETAVEARSAKAELDAELEAFFGTAERETVKEAAGFRDAEGRLVGTASFEFDGEDVDTGFDARAESGRKGKARELRSMRLSGERDGKPLEIDVLALANRHGTKVLVAKERLTSYQHRREENVVIVPPLETPSDVAIMLHELGHADQHRDERFKDLEGHYYGGALETKGWQHDLRRQVDEMTRMVPDAKDVIDPQGVEKLEAIRMRAAAADGELAVMKKGHDDLADKAAAEGKKLAAYDQYLTPEQRTARADEIAAVRAEAGRLEGLMAESAARMEAKRAEIDRAAAEYDALLRETNIGPLFDLPTKLLERDATRRALQWMRTIRAEAGVDLFVPHAIPEKADGAAEAGACETSVSDGVGDPETASADVGTAQEFMKDALRSYRADTHRMRRTDADVGVMPEAGKKRGGSFKG